MRDTFRHAVTAREYIEQRYVIDKDTGCWLWIGEIANNGYGNAKICGSRWGERRIHRLSYRVYKLDGRKIPEGVLIRHRCNTRRCINPAHLFGGSDLENHDDYKSARLSRNSNCKFEDFPGARQMFARFVRELGKKFDLDDIEALLVAKSCLRHEIRQSSKPL